jgi:TPR repeat protein
VAALEQPLTTIVSEAAGAETTGVRNRFGKPARYIVGGAVAAMLLSGAVGYEWLARKPATVRGALRGSERSTEPPPLAPVIVTFLADPPAIGMGAQATLSWEVGAATEVAIEPSVGKVHAADKVLVKPATSTRYVLTATSAGGTVSQETFVDVRPPSPLQLFLAGESKIRAKQFADGLTLLRRAGELGETRAMMELGEIYWEGREGQNKDEPEALRWFRKAAEADVVQGMLYLGGFYEQGIGVPESPELAVQWYRKAAQRHSPDGTFDLGRMYDEGRGVARDMARARELYQTAARMGNADATKRLIELGGH